ncbi:hypothetical protein [Candidatus Methanoperedens nitratireducens]|uniref:Uncharacterized protein n=1 Tax=Candidatus Methanoperedens nitratireducens TaxID=1392998 RepID=A0A284VPN6_9EURY|nr:hypothetical protein [Candidatus Methanoperedens nitroreducens]SNQ61178.1 hypothetical protein MNV_2470002 [Candidatus Methanoperedens nitroreducens]
MFHQQSVRALYTRRFDWISLVVEVVGMLITAVYLTKADPTATGGPDAFGYTFIDSNEPGGPIYAWEEISSTGTLVTDWTDFNNGFAGPIPIGFSFNYYGNAYPELYVNTNGYVSFEQGYLFAPPCCGLPNTSTPNNDIALFGDDLQLINYGTESAVYYQTLSNPNRLVIEFVNMYYCCGYPPYVGHTLPGHSVRKWRCSSPNTQTMNGNTSTYVGIENQNGTDGLGYTASPRR